MPLAFLRAGGFLYNGADNMDTIEIKGQFNTALCYARVIDNNAIEQIQKLCDCQLPQPMTKA